MTKSPPPSEELIRSLSQFDLKVAELAFELRKTLLKTKEHRASVETRLMIRDIDG
ncbi:MAG: hypothetical protein AABO57_07330 [Acidobacteriota bacterium]